MDSPGINILIAAHTALAHAGGWLRLAAATASVRGTLQIVGLDHVINCRATLHRGLST
jgi:anti-anti-sigma regulatory factor